MSGAVAAASARVVMMGWGGLRRACPVRSLATRPAAHVDLGDVARALAARDPLSAPQRRPARRPVAPKESDFPAGVVVYDGVCALCNFGIRWVAARDPFLKIGFVALQSDAAQPLLQRTGITHADIDKGFALISSGDAGGADEHAGAGHSDVVHRAAAAVYAVGEQLPPPWSHLARAVRAVVPLSLADRMYYFVADNRKKWFGEYETCPADDREDVLVRCLDRSSMEASTAPTYADIKTTRAR